ncbi:hypothetical protein J4573_19075 [Actinomadura barringtoniae]|uniref:DUF5753 domain-containing protein n=1 Tax=Actinomadura barringtoniae TaxID=1427535 RepID=A0A939TAL7_9ACTN|nr:hypothetical protein [Actinomadura barringtoniae]
MVESLLYRPVGGPEVMRGQLEMLLKAADLRSVTMQVIPQSAGFYRGLYGSFNGLTMERGDLAFVEAPGGRLIQGSTEVRDFGVLWAHIGASALPRNSSRDLPEKALQRYA